MKYKLAGLMDCCSRALYHYTGPEGPGLRLECGRCRREMQLGVDGIWSAVPKPPVVDVSSDPAVDSADPVVETKPPAADLSTVLVHEEDPDSGKHRHIRPEARPEQVPPAAGVSEPQQPSELVNHDRRLVYSSETPRLEGAE